MAVVSQFPTAVATSDPPRPAVPFTSILCEGPDSVPPGQAATRPECFHDLGLDQIVDAVVAPWKDYDLAGFFHVNLSNTDAVVYRQEVMRDLERAEVMTVIRAFAKRMREMRQELPLAAKRYNTHERNRWHLGAVQRYVEAIETLRDDLAPLALRSRGLSRWRDYVGGYADSPTFLRLTAHTGQVLRELSMVAYAVTIDGATVVVRRYAGETNYAAEIEETFAKFRRGAVKSYLAKLPVTAGLNHIEAQVLDRVARLHPDVFGSLAAFRAEHEHFVDECVARFEREIHFYIGWLDFIAPFRSGGLSFCYPAVSASKAISVRDAFDLALARRLLPEDKTVVCNDFALAGQERIFVVTGPNQGGKTTFARLFGQLHWLASLGCATPGSDAKLALFDRMFAHFEREEDIHNLRGKLHDDLVRMHRILAQATPSSIVVMNEIFSSTTLRDAVFLGREVLLRLNRLDLLAVCVTFLDELASGDAKVVSLVAGIDPVDPAARTFKLERRRADGLAHAMAIAEKYHVTESWLKKRIPA